MKRFFLLFPILLISNAIFAQVSSFTRNKESYTQEIFPYKGVRAIQIDEVSSPDHEENVFIFSKVEKNANPDIMYFQRFTKIDGKWTLKILSTIEHKGIISSWGSRKAFGDFNKDKSVDAFFIYGLYDAGFKQQTVHLIFSQFDKIYTIEANISDNFETDIFSDNFDSLDENIKKEILDYWSKLDKLDK
ncbi:hypothetical protein [Flavobacterium sp.]|uniref:hypothetical protein n=1 Tax=Flavobacterium sp. TaxID=239 RepID=UPI00286E3530|nr:hypothetical protein [Flavobacterium sp.]